MNTRENLYLKIFSSFPYLLLDVQVGTVLNLLLLDHPLLPDTRFQILTTRVGKTWEG